MMARLNTMNTRGGFTVLYAVLVASLVLAIGAVVFSITFRELVLTSQIRDSNKAFYAADSAIECALYWDSRTNSPPAGLFGGLTKGNLDENLIARWTLDDGAGSTAVDSAGGNDGTLQNGPVWTSGQLSGALDFDGADDHVTYGLELTKQEGTIMHWLLADQARAMVAVYESDCTSGSCNGYGDTNSRVEIHTGTNSGGTQWNIFYQDGTPTSGQKTVSGGTVTPGQWAHVAATWDRAGLLQLYINGQPVNSIDMTTTSFSSHPSSVNQIGRVGSGASTRHWDGKIDDVRIFDKELPAGDILAIYEGTQQEFHGPEDANSSVFCAGEDITHESGWVVEETNKGATTTFDMLFDDSSCASITVVKDNTGYGRFDARGYNTCDLANPRRIERGLRVTY